MTRKDTILIAVVINAGLLAILFITAVIYDTGSGLVPPAELVADLSDGGPLLPSSSSVLSASGSSDEGAHPHPSLSTASLRKEGLSELGGGYPSSFSPAMDEFSEEETSPPIDFPVREGIVEVKVKKGDVLEKIARTHNTTVAAIKQANHLQSERLSIGQVLKIPVKKAAPPSPVESPAVYRQEPPQGTARLPAQKEVYPPEAVYYTIKSGDNPWKIAKQCNVKYEDILRLNGLDEEKARTLKIGDRIRVK